jgi:hypothetical protein
MRVRLRLFLRGHIPGADPFQDICPLGSSQRSCKVARQCVDPELTFLLLLAVTAEAVLLQKFLLFPAGRRQRIRPCGQRPRVREKNGTQCGA